MELQKQAYQISLWEDKNKYAVVMEQGQDPVVVETLPANYYQLINDWMDEHLLAVIGSNTMDAPIRAYDPKLTTNINGSSKFTFQMFYQFYDESLDMLRDNPFISLISNERKIKLSYGGQWYDFIIKKIEESTDQKQITVTCEDQYVTELGKNGYDITFDIELANNMGTINELASAAVEDTDWTVVAPGAPVHLNDGSVVSSDTLLSKNTEVLYPYITKRNWEATNLNTGDTVDIRSGSTILVSSSSYTNKTDQIQFLWVEDGDFKADGNGIVVNSDNYTASADQDYKNSVLYVSNSFKGEMFVQQPITKWIPEIDECADVFVKNGVDYYGVKRTEYLGQKETQELLLNNSNFSTNDYWEPQKTVYSDNVNSQTGKAEPTLTLDFSQDGYVANTGIQVNLGAFDPMGFTPNERMVFAIKGSSEAGGRISGAALYSLPMNAEYPTVAIQRTGDENAALITTNANNSIIPGYSTFFLRSNCSMSYEDMLQQVWELRIFGSNTFKLEGCLLFKEHYDANGNLVIPDMSLATDQVVQDVYYLFKTDKVSDAVSSLANIAIDAMVPADELATNGFALKVNDSPYEKITSITISKSNHFNIIQTLCETFKCWARFTIDHDKTGHVIYSYDPINDFVPKTGQQYFIARDSASEDAQEDLKFELADFNTFFSRANTYSKTENDNGRGYWLKQDGQIYTRIDLGYQFSDSSYTYYVFNENTENYSAATSYDADTVYYLRNSDGVNTYYQRVVVGNEFTDGIYYKVNSSVFNSQNLYERNYHKYISFSEFVGQENQAGFRYGVNLKSINRSIDSASICSRLIVPANNNQYSDTGDGFCSIQTSSLNPTGESAIYNFQYYVQQHLLNSRDLNRDLYGDATGGLAYLSKLGRWNREVAPKILEQSKLLIEMAHLSSRRQIYNTLIASAEEQLEELISNIMSATGKSYESAYNLLYDDSRNTDVVKSYVKKRDTTQKIIDQYTQTRQEINTLANISEQKYQAITANLLSVTEKKKALNREFYKKYSRFIQEGTWSSEDYINADRYYLAACDVMVTSGFPQISYTIDVMDVSMVDGCHAYSFKIGDKTYVEDTEFFGWVPETNRPYQEEVVVSEVTYSLDDPSQNTIKVQNYKTRFDDLFNRIAAATQSLQYHEGAYNRASEAVNPNGTLNGALLKKSLAENSAIISNANSQSVVWDENGISITDLVHNNKQVRLVGGGIALTKDGGNTWYTGITADGINASKITTGSLNTQLISIYNEDSPTFTWDKNGINAYAFDEAGTNYGQFIRLDKFGLYGVRGESKDSFAPATIQEVKDAAHFALTWDGLLIKGQKGAESQAEIIANSSDGVKLSFSKNNNYLNIGFLGTGSGSNLERVINANDQFIVYEDGSVLANNGTFNGILKAQGLYINGENALDGNKIKSNFLDLGNIILDGNSGNITLSGNISFDSSAQSSIRTVADDGALSAAYSAQSSASSAASIAKRIANGTYPGTFIDWQTISSPEIIGGTFYSVDSKGYMELDSNSLEFYTKGNSSNFTKKITLGSSEIGSNSYPYLTLGAGGYYGDNKGIVKKLSNGIWIGSSGSGNSVLDISESSELPGTGASGIFINFNGPLQFYGDAEEAGTVAIFG